MPEPVWEEMRRVAGTGVGREDGGLDLGELREAASLKGRLERGGDLLEGARLGVLDGGIRRVLFMGVLSMCVRAVGVSACVVGTRQVPCSGGGVLE